jgi:lipopolysaccharide biosynthesis protein
VPYDLFVTTTTAAKRSVILQALEGHDVAHVEVRIVADNRGRDTSAMLLASKDVFDDDRYDLVCRVHSKKSPQDSYNTADLFKHHMFDNLLCTPGYVANVLRLFDEQPTLGMVFPPVIHIGYPTLGHAWFTNRPLAESVARQLGVSVVFDADTPIAPYGSMFWARPRAMRKLVDFPWAWTDFPDEGGYRDGGLPHVLERLLAYTVLDAGYHVRSVMNRDWASINHAFLEYKLQKVTALLPPQTQEQLEYLQQAHAQTNLLGALKSEVDRRYPRAAQVARPGYRMARAVGRRTRGRSAR